MVAVSKKTEVKQISNVTELESNGKGSITYDKEVILENGNKCPVVKIEYTRNPIKEEKTLVLQYEDDTDRVKDIVSRLSEYQTLKTDYEQTQNTDSLIAATNLANSLESDYKFSIKELNEKTATIKSYVNYTIAQNALNSDVLDYSLIKAVLVLNNLLTIN